MRKIPWERLPNGETADLYEGAKMPGTPFFMMQAAFGKMCGVNTVGAYFDSEYGFYEKSCFFFRDSITTAEFIGVYTPDEEDPGVPSACVRRMIWDKKRDNDLCRNGADVPEHLLSDRQLDGGVFFVGQQQYSPVSVLIQEVKELLRAGVRVEEVSNEDSSIQRLTFFLEVDSDRYEVAYNPFVSSCPPLEDWGERFSTAVSFIDLKSTILPTKEFRMSYQCTVFDYIDRIVQYHGESLSQYFKPE